MRDVGCLLAGAVALGLVAAIAIPNLAAPRCGHSNDTAAIATLRNLASVQAEFRERGLCDLDGDGIGEHGTLGELTGAAGVRGDAAAAVRGEEHAPPLLAPALALVDGSGGVRKAGFRGRDGNLWRRTN